MMVELKARVCSVETQGLLIVEKLDKKEYDPEAYPLRLVWSERDTTYFFDSEKERDTAYMYLLQAKYEADKDRRKWWLDKADCRAI